MLLSSLGFKMKLHILYKDTNKGETCYTFFKNYFRAMQEIYNKEYACKQQDVESHWKLKEIETED